MFSRRDVFRIAASAAGAGLFSQRSLAHGYPAHPVTVIVPFPPGGATDVLPRLIASKMQDSLGQPFIVENMSGAGGSIGVGRAARAQPDGYTIVSGNLSTFVLNGALYKLPYDLVADFAPIILLPSSSHMLVARPSMPARDLTALIEDIRTNAGKITMATAGVGTGSHLAAVLLQKALGVQFPLVHYRGGGPALQDLIGGHVDIMCNQAAVFLPQVKEGQLKAYAVLAAERLREAPDIPTTDEAGLPGLHASIWNGLWAPKNTPADVVETLNGAVRLALADEATRRAIDTLAYEFPPPDQMTPQALAAFQRAEIEKWWPIVKEVIPKAE